MKKARGFTLIELLVVIAIIGILSSIVVAGLSQARAGSRDARRISDLKSIQLALSLYYNDNNFYPQDIYTTYDASNGVSPQDGLVSSSYISAVPKDPKDNTTNYKFYALRASGGSNCLATEFPIRYHLGAVMETLTTTALPSDDADFSTSLTACASATKFYGNSANCPSTAGGTENCYDVVPN